MTFWETLQSKLCCQKEFYSTSFSTPSLQKTAANIKNHVPPALIKQARISSQQVGIDRAHPRQTTIYLYYPDIFLHEMAPSL